MQVFIGGVPKTATEAQIKVFCEKVGEVCFFSMQSDMKWIRACMCATEQSRREDWRIEQARFRARNRNK